MRIEPLGDRALLVDLGGGIDAETLARVRSAASRIEAAAIRGVTDVAPAYTTIAVHYDPLAVLGCAVIDRPPGSDSPQPASRVVGDAVRDALAAGSAGEPPPEPAMHEIPVAYGGRFGPDLDDVAARSGMSREEVIAAHSGATYTVHLVGFVPGFPYLGGLPPRLATPRRDVPRASVPAGSVGVGGAQTGIYPIASPGGWNLIGRTTLRLFDVTRARPALLRIGDRVRFRAIDPAGDDDPGAPPA